jgi:hypothetical protein
MPQGKIKVKTKGAKPPTKKDKPAKKPAGVKKGKLVFAAKKVVNIFCACLWLQMISLDCRFCSYFACRL